MDILKYKVGNYSEIHKITIEVQTWVFAKVIILKYLKHKSRYFDLQKFVLENAWNTKVSIWKYLKY